MRNDVYILLTEKSWHVDLFNKLQVNRSLEKWILINKKEDFNFNKISKLSPKKIFIPHWSYFISENIFKSFECVVFHMTDLPFGRGGSPLQNLIVRKFKETKISAIKVEKDIDSGDVYLKKKLSLKGTAEEIFVRSSKIIYKMIIQIVDQNLSPSKQVGEPYFFERRTSEMSNISELSTFEEIYDYIRMLDADGYPNAFIETKDFKFEFSKAKIKNNEIIGNVRISKK